MMKTIIFVDDSKTVLATAKMALDDLIESGAVGVLTYDDPVKLFEELAAGSVDFDLLVSDINMPQMNGLELVRQIKQVERFRTRPVVMLTTENSADMKVEGKSIGVSGWMVKPMNETKLLQMVKMVLGIAA